MRRVAPRQLEHLPGCRSSPTSSVSIGMRQVIVRARQRGQMQHPVDLALDSRAARKRPAERIGSRIAPFEMRQIFAGDP